MQKTIRIGTRESQLAVWQSTLVKEMLAKSGYPAELVYIKSEGDIDLKTPLYEMGVQGVFTRSLDIALLNGKIDIAVHSMKDVPTQTATGIVQCAVLKRASHKDIFVHNGDISFLENNGSSATIATSSIRRKAQWLNKFPEHQIVNLRGNVNTRLQKVRDHDWNGAIFAAAGLERIELRPENAIDLNWMLPAPAQGAIMVVCREADDLCISACEKMNDSETALCTKAERDFLKYLLGGCSTPISALAEIINDMVVFKGNILSLDGKEKEEIEIQCEMSEAEGLGTRAAKELIENGGNKIIESIRNAAKQG